MTSPQRIAESEIVGLRHIGWNLWDPLKLSGLGWQFQGGENEYDDYLTHAFSLFKSGASCEEVSKYLISIETERMEHNEDSAMIDRAAKTASAVWALVGTAIVK